ncbi:MAG: ABC transporter substrate binding protein [Methylococcales bacterium]|nr:ABC transporter substrate binding protein [Methylococcales bacterium]
MAITVLLSQETAPYRQVLQGIRESFAIRHPDITIHVKRLDDLEPLSLTQKILDQAPQVLVPIGQKATDFALTHLQPLPVCAALVLNESTLRNAANATGVLLRFALPDQIRGIRAILTKNQSLALLYRPEQQVRAQRFQALAREQQLTVTLHPVTDLAELLPLLESLPRETALFYSFADSGIFTPPAAKTLLLFSFRNRIPLLGLSREWAKAGALFALERDYIDIGRQCGEQILGLLNGQSPAELTLASPRQMRFAFNLKTARHMKFTPPDTLLSHAEHFD